MKWLILFFVILFIFFSCVLDITKDINTVGTITLVNNGGMPSTKITKLGFKLDQINDFRLDNEDLIKNNQMSAGNVRSFSIAPGNYKMIVQTLYSTFPPTDHYLSVSVKSGETKTVYRTDFPVDGNW
jgi:hypothetical protein